MGVYDELNIIEKNYYFTELFTMTIFLENSEGVYDFIPANSEIKCLDLF